MQELECVAAGASRHGLFRTCPRRYATDDVTSLPDAGETTTFAEREYTNGIARGTGGAK